MRGIFVRYAAAAALAAGLLFGQAPVESQPPQPGTRQFRYANRLNQVAQILELTPDQRTHMQTIIQQGMDSARPLIQQLRQNRLQMKQLIDSGTTGPQFDAQVQQFASAQGQLVGQLAAIRARAVAQIYSMLNPQQRQRAIALHSLMMPHRGHGGED